MWVGLGCRDFGGLDILSGVAGGEGLAVVGVMSFLSASEAESLLKTPSSFGRSEFGDGDSVNIHGVGIFLWSGSEGGGLGSSPSKC